MTMAGTRKVKKEKHLIDEFFKNPCSSKAYPNFYASIINWQETGEIKADLIQLYHSTKRKTISVNFCLKMKIKAFEELRKAKAEAGDYELLIWHKEDLKYNKNLICRFARDVGTLVILRRRNFESELV